MNVPDGYFETAGYYNDGPDESYLSSLGFIPELFWLTLEKKGNILWIHYITCHRKFEGHTQRVLRSLLEDGWDVRIVRPGSVMDHIGAKLGMFETEEVFEDRYNQSPVTVLKRKYVPSKTRE